MVYIIFVSVAVPLIMLLFMAEGRSRTIIGLVVLGITCAVLSYEINSLIKDIFEINEFDFRIFISPMTEELIKFMAILFFSFPILFYNLSHNLNKKFYPIEAAMALGIGFAIFENIYLLVVSYKYVNIFWAIIRGFSTGLMHGMTTAAVSYIMTFIKKRKLFYTGMMGLLCISITYHGIYNLLVESKYNYVGFVIPIFTYIFLFYKKITTRHSAKLNF